MVTQHFPQYLHPPEINGSLERVQRDTNGLLHPLRVSVPRSAQDNALLQAVGLLPMASRSWLTHRAALVLLALTWRHVAFCGGLTADPPEDLEILDPGHLGRLEIRWSPPSSSVSARECSVRYQLEYFDAYQDTWSAIRTPRRSYSAQFDLMKDVRVRVYTLLSGPCTNGTTIQSSRYTEVVQKAPAAGAAVQDVTCVFHNMEFMECKWKANPKMPTDSQLNLYFWHKELEHAEECPKYIISGGIRSGCTFMGNSLPDFTDINLCVNGSSHEGALTPAFISLQTQNQVKPGTTDKLYLHTDRDAQLELEWEGPAGGVPGDCLEWEVEHSRQGLDGRLTSQHILTQDTSLTVNPGPRNERYCFRVRSKLHKYCAHGGFWSEWSRPTCHPDFPESEPGWGQVPIYVYVAVGVIITLVLLMSVWAVLHVSRWRQDKKPYSLLTNLFARSSLTVVEA
ncbi:interleukin-13 receptor subunit alpha-2 isoform X2 [Betta splendens]|uniref:Interleukin-13 receptor subunit alpha-2 isoform X2 n=1 Tax=Betta splendens TaxID=158456 RepID=A0A9W2Y907_BETSP|nr:interleukin-13 receptor subunit alpha-2 isoform X2 [Betta splendens]